MVARPRRLLLANADVMASHDRGAYRNHRQLNRVEIASPDNSERDDGAVSRTTNRERCLPHWKADVICAA
jgi:hypothetical protein